jgi:SAM-dependent methyltransferase
LTAGAHHTTPDASRYFEQRRADLRASPPWHPLAHIIRLLPRRLEEMAAELRVTPGGRVLDFGCADMPYRRFFGADVEFVGADLPGNPQASIHVRPDGTLPGDDASFDAVLSTQVLEHVSDPEVYLGECLRVLRPGGRLLLSTHGLMVYHPDPVDYWRWTCEGLRRAVEQTGFEIVRFEGIMGLGASGLQLVQDAAYNRTPRWLRPALCLIMQSMIAVSDRLEHHESRNLNALVFALVAEKA